MLVKKHKENKQHFLKEQLHTPRLKTTTPLTHQPNTSSNLNDAKKISLRRELAVVSGAIIMILSVPMGVNLFFLILFTEKEQLILNIIGTIITTGLIVLFGLFGTRISKRLHKLALLLIFFSIPFGIFHILLRSASIIYKQNVVYSAILAIILFTALIIGFKKNTQKE